MRETGHDGIREKLRVQIKYGGGEKTNMDLGNPDKYEEIYVVLGKSSKVRSYPSDADFLIYIMTSDQVKAIDKTEKGKYSRGVTLNRHHPPRHSAAVKNAAFRIRLATAFR
jgi:sigma54-dependent transcription regulator